MEEYDEKEGVLYWGISAMSTGYDKSENVTLKKFKNMVHLTSFQFMLPDS